MPINVAGYTNWMQYLTLASLRSPLPRRACRYVVRGKPGILDLLTAEKISVTDELMTWPDAIYFAGEPLIRDGSIVEKYSDGHFKSGGTIFAPKFNVVLSLSPRNKIDTRIFFTLSETRTEFFCRGCGTQTPSMKFCPC